MVRGRRTKRIRANDEGRPTGGEVYTREEAPSHPGVGKGPPPPKKVWKIQFKKKI